MTLEPSGLPLDLRWTPVEVYSIHAAVLHGLAGEYAQAGDVTRAYELEQLAIATESALMGERAVQRDCAMAACDEPVTVEPIVVNMPTLPGPFAIDLCGHCREPFEAGMEAVERLVEGDAEAARFRFGRQQLAELESER